MVGVIGSSWVGEEIEIGGEKQNKDGRPPFHIGLRLLPLPLFPPHQAALRFGESLPRGFLSPPPTSQVQVVGGVLAN